MTLTVVADAEAAARRVADQLAWRLNDARRRDGPFHVALAGGATPRRVYELLGATEGSWDHAHLWLGDERCVPRDHPESNARMVDESLYANARARPPRLHPIDGSAVPEDAAWLYARELADQVPGGVFDLVLLGLGEDGHTASLFPDHHTLEVASVPCLAVRDAPKPPAQRITLTLPVLRRAEHAILLTAGEAKREPLRRTLAGPDPATPASLLGDDLDEIVCDVAADPR
ncbi:MAG TPA: 6-phosphogluconolactonase [Solirubrobacteraceae bacterium]|nr:6-phosphogluconolactonase [Solirubrobacteraceae bacterium]